MSLPVPVTILADDLNLRTLLHAVCVDNGHAPHVSTGSRFIASRNGLVIEHVGRELRLYRAHSRKARHAAFVLPYPPLALDKLVPVLNRRAAEIQKQAHACRHDAPVLHDQRIICAPDSPMQTVLTQIRLFGPVDDPVLVTGETGTGKELVVRAIHHASARASRPLVMVNCAALPEPLLESELFGHAKGSFTGAHTTKLGLLETAHGGTAVLDEINSMPVGLQAKLLRFLQHGELRRVGDNHTGHVSVRVLATSNQSLPDLISNGRFRADLYYRLSALEIAVPPLRDRRMDVPLLVAHFCQHQNRQAHAKSLATLSQHQNHPWPGNVRELQNHVRRALVLLGTNGRMRDGDQR